MSSAKPITCRAAILYEYNKPLVIEQVRIDPPVGDQVRVKLVSSGICLSDVVLYRGKSTAEEAANKLPLVLGHEGAGIVESVGSEVTDLKVGDHVLTTFLPRCNDCAFCSNPRVNICAKQNFLTLGSLNNKTVLSSGKGIQGFAGLGTFSEYLLVRQSQLEKIDAKLPNLENLSIVTCGIGSGYFANYQGNVEANSTVAIWDFPSFGVNTAYGAKLRGAKNIIVIDPSAEKAEWKELAKEFGVTEFLNPAKLGDKTVDQYLLEKYGGVDYAFDCNGDPESHRQALASLNPGGTFTFVALTYTGAKVEVPVSQLFTGKLITASVYGRKPTDEAYREILNLYRIGRYPIEKLVSHKLPLEKINEGFQLVVDHKAIKVVIKF